MGSMRLPSFPCRKDAAPARSTQSKGAWPALDRHSRDKDADWYQQLDGSFSDRLFISLPSENRHSGEFLWLDLHTAADQVQSMRCGPVYDQIAMFGPTHIEHCFRVTWATVSIHLNTPMLPAWTLPDSAGFLQPRETRITYPWATSARLGTARPCSAQCRDNSTR